MILRGDGLIICYPNSPLGLINNMPTSNRNADVAPQ